MRKFIQGLFLGLLVAVTPVMFTMAQEEDDRSWIESLPPNQDSIETPYFIRDREQEEVEADAKLISPLIPGSIAAVVAAGSCVMLYQNKHKGDK